MDIGKYHVRLIAAPDIIHPLMSLAYSGTWLSDPLQETKYGRRPALFMAAILCAACAIGTFNCWKWSRQ
jgi:hypothetical protein